MCFPSGSQSKACGEHCAWKVVDFVPCIRMLFVQKFEKKSLRLYFDLSRCLNTYLRNYWLDSFHQGPNEKLSACGEPIDWENVDFLLCIRSLIVRKFQKALSLSIRLDFRTHTYIQVSFIQSRSQSKDFRRGRFWLKIIYFGLWSVDSKVCFFIVHDMQTLFSP